MRCNIKFLSYQRNKDPFFWETSDVLPIQREGEGEGEGEGEW